MFSAISFGCPDQDDEDEADPLFRKPPPFAVLQRQSTDSDVSDEKEKNAEAEKEKEEIKNNSDREKKDDDWVQENSNIDIRQKILACINKY